MGSTTGSSVGSAVGSGVGSSVGSAVGSGVGSSVGSAVGSGVGSSIGSGAGSSTTTSAASITSSAVTGVSSAIVAMLISSRVPTRSSATMRLNISINSFAIYSATDWNSDGNNQVLCGSTEPKFAWKKIYKYTMYYTTLMVKNATVLRETEQNFQTFVSADGISSFRWKVFAAKISVKFIKTLLNMDSPIP